jgi:CO/xanthine dehydrogenase Mo-binding subunit
MSARPDAGAKAQGSARYVADLVLPGMTWVAMVRSPHPHARIVSIDTRSAKAADGVVGVFTAADVASTTYGRSLLDAPLLAAEETRFVGERVAAVVAHSLADAERATDLVVVEYEPRPAVLTPAEALEPHAPRVHAEPASYIGAAATPEDGPNVVYHGTHGSLDAAEEALLRAAFMVDATYRAHSVHQGYLEPQACVADYHSEHDVRVWLTTKAPYKVRSTIADCLGLASDAVDLQPVLLGGDFGGKGSSQDAVLCVELSRLVRRPVKSVLRYSEDLTATNPRHSAEVRVRLGADADGRFVAAAISATLNAGAYGGFTPSARGPHGIVDVASYRIPAFFSETTRVYTHTVPRGNMRAPGAPQGVFAFESAVDELAGISGIDPVELRRRNLLTTGEADPSGQVWVERRGHEVLDAALAEYRPIESPVGWLHGRGVAAYSRSTAARANTSLGVSAARDGRIRVECPVVETGTGSHSVLRELMAQRLGVEPSMVEVVATPTSGLPFDQGAGGSRVTVGMAAAVEAAVEAWRRADGKPVTVEAKGPTGPPVGTDLVQIAQVAVDPETGEVDVLEVLTAIDVAEIIRPAAFRMQVDGGVVMGYGYACLEDLGEADGRMAANSLREFKLPTTADVPQLRTVLVRGSVGVGWADVKNIGETTTPAVAAAIANAVADAVGLRFRELPLTAERVLAGLSGAR